MPLYDQTNPNFAFVTVPSSTWSSEAQPTWQPPLLQSSSEPSCGTTIIPDPYYTSWLPVGPISGDPGALGCWWYTAICGPTAESMALMAVINGRGSATSYTGWTQSFVDASSPTDQVGSVPNPTFIPSFSPSVSGTPNRLAMTGSDVQRVILMAIKQGTLPNAGGGMDAILSTASDFTPAATGSWGDANTISDATFSAAINSGSVIVFAIHEYTATITQVSGTSDQVTFKFNGGGHILAVNGDQLGVLTIYDPVYAVRETLTMESISTGTFPKQNGGTRTITPPESGLNTAAIWPDPNHPIQTPLDIVDQQVITFIDAFLQFKVD
jgi:hypothetical protein